MPFPFLPFGALVAAAFLGGVFALLYVVVTRLDRAIVEVGGSVVGGLVSGLDDWNHERAARGQGRQEALTSTSSIGDPFEDAAPIAVEPSRRTGP